MGSGFYFVIGLFRQAFIVEGITKSPDPNSLREELIIVDFFFEGDQKEEQL
jgi:hypothetical protein